MRPSALLTAATVLVALAGAATGCGDDPPRQPAPTATATATAPEPGPEPGPGPDPEPGPEPGTVPPPWLGTRELPRRPDGFGEVRPTPPGLRLRRFTLPDTVDPLPGRGFAAVVETVPRSVLARSTWRPGCPVGAEQLRWVRLTFRGFDGARHTGELLVNDAVAGDVVAVFRALWRARYPVEEMRITRPDELDAPPTGDGNTTGAFVCRPTVGQTTFSQHAYGLAIDVNPFHNPYVKVEGDDRLVLPELASSYLERDGRPGVIRAGDAVVRAFAAVGWEWGGDWRSLKDFQHFSLNGL